MILDNIVSKISKFPSKLDSHLGELLKDELKNIDPSRTVNKNSKTIMYRYPFQLNDTKYLFIVEYIFKERETFLELKRAIGINYYLYKDE